MECHRSPTIRGIVLRLGLVVRVEARVPSMAMARISWCVDEQGGGGGARYCDGLWVPFKVDF